MISAMKKVYALDLRVHFLRAALYWRKEVRYYESKNNPDMVNWCKGRRIEAMDAVRWVRELAGGLL